jgi:hypothetical protein
MALESKADTLAETRALFPLDKRTLKAQLGVSKPQTVLNTAHLLVYVRSRHGHS